MYLAIMLIIVALLVFYNEFNNKLSISEYVILIISLIAIIRASINYINFDMKIEGFNSNIKKDKNKQKKIYYKNNKEENNEENNEANYKANDKANDKDILIIKSEESDVYLDSDEIQSKSNNSFTNYKNSNNADNADKENKINSSHINKVNDLLGISSNFADIPIPTDYMNKNDDEIKSIFSPKVIIGKGSNNDEDGFGSRANSSYWNSGFVNDGFGFNNTMNPVKNLWNVNQGYYNNNGNDGNNNDGIYCNNRGQNNNRNNNNNGDENGNGNCRSNNMQNSISNDQWSQSMDAYNKGKWNSNQYNRPSDYVDYVTPNGYGTTTPDSLNMSQNNSNQSESSNEENKKMCGDYTDLDENQAGDLIVKDYKQSKKWVAGYTYVPPIHWDVPQRRSPVCRSVSPIVQKLTGLVDKGLPINALELDQNGRIADTEDTVRLSNVGSMIPRFNYQEQPFSKPYI
jgi:hypothetical protein